MTNDLNFEQNANGVYVPSQPAKRLRSFCGRMIDQMPQLLSGKDEEGKIVVDVPRKLMTPKQLVTERVNGQDTNDGKLLIANYVDTAYAVIPDPTSDEVILAPYSNVIVKGLIDGLNPKSVLVNRFLPVSVEQYQAIKSDVTSYTLPASIANELRENPYSNENIRVSAWDKILEGDNKLRAKNLSLVQKIKGGSMKDRMALVLRRTKGLGLLVVGSVGFNNSDAYGYDGLDVGNSRLVGVAPEAPSRENGAHAPTLEQMLALANEFVAPASMEAYKTRLSAEYSQ